MPPTSPETPAVLRLADRNRFFTATLAASLLLHLAVSAVLLSKQLHSGFTPTVTYIDLKTIRAATPLAKPAPSASPAPKAAEPVLPDTPPPASDYDRLQDNVREALKTAQSKPEAVNDVSFGLGMTNGYFSSLGEGKSLRPDIREYYFDLLRQINEKWWVDRKGQAGFVRNAVINVVIDRSGAVVQLELAASSGNPSWDRAMMQSLQAASPLPPLPTTFTDDFFRAPLRFVAPLNLMLPAGNGVKG